MILFLEDWKKYPTAIVNLETTNRSFVRLASVYREMGVDNHAFLLALVNPELVGIDPHSKNLTLDQMAAIAYECQQNPWFFFREVARAPAIGSSETSMLEANRGNIALFWCFFNHIMIILIQIRQTGKSFNTDILMNLLMNILCENTAINLLTKDDNLRRKNIERIKDIGSELPRYLQMRTKDDVNNGEEVTIKARGNTYNTHVPQSSAKRALNMGRGLTSAIFHIDEPPFQPNIALALPAALAATGAAVEAEKKAGTPYGTILTTTAGKKDDRDGRFIFNLLSESAIWTEKFLDAPNQEELEKMIKRNSRTGVCRINATFNHRQLGKSDAWLKEKIDAALQEGDDANRDFFNMWTSGSQSNPLPLHILEMISKSQMGPAYTDISKPYGYITRWYIPEETIGHRMATGTFVLGMDTSEASGGDAISLVLTDIETLEIVAVGEYNETNLITFSEWVCSILVTYKTVTAIIERRSTGAMLLDYLLLMLPQPGEDPFKRLYNTVVNDYEEERERWREICTPMNRRSPDIYIRYKKTFGFATSGSGATSRTELYSTTLQNAAKRAGESVRDKSLIDQITGLVTRNGRIDHEVGEHDDLLIGWLLCHWLLSLGKNLSHYGIDHRRIKVVTSKIIDENPKDAYTRHEQQLIRNRIEDIYAELSDERDEYVSRRLEQELRVLDKKIILESGEIYSVDALIKQAQETKRNKRRDYNPSRNNYNGYASQNNYNEHGSFSNNPYR